LDPINQELALHWLRRGYNLMTEKELSDAILKATGQRLMPDTLKKRRGRLGLSTKRPPGPRPNSEQ
jgi:transposase